MTLNVGKKYPIKLSERFILHYTLTQWMSGARPLGPKEIDGLLVSPGKAYTLLSDYWLLYILGPPMYEPAQEKWFNSNHS